MPHAPTRIATILLLALLTGCAKEPGVVAAVPRPVKVEVIGSSPDSGNESFVGTLRAHQRSELGFETGGRIASILVEVGDRVRAGQVLARLEEGPAQWRLDKAEADHAAAAAALAERTTQLRQNEALASEKIISPTSLESVQTQHRVALSQLQTADAAVALARRELTLSRITAPFDGEIVARAAQPHSDIAAGQTVFNIEAGRTLEVMAMLPDSVAARLVPGSTATATTSGQEVLRLPLKLDKLSARTESGSLVPAIFRLTNSSTGLRSGSVVSVDLPRAAPADIAVPAPALMPGNENGTGSVFILDSSSGRLVRRQVTFDNAVLPGGRIPITSGLRDGDQVVVAGTAFLSEGQPAVKHDRQTLLAGNQR